MKKFNEMGIKQEPKGFTGDKIKINKVLNCEIIIRDYKLADSKFENGNGKCLHMQVEWKGTLYVLFTGSVALQSTIQKVAKEDFPFTATIIKDNDRLEFR